MSEAERETVAERAWREHPDEMARAHTEFEVADLEARLAETEAIIEKVREARRENVGDGEWFYSTFHIDHALYSHRPSVLEAHDLALAKRAWDEGWAEGHDPHNGSVNPYGFDTEGKDQ